MDYHETVVIEKGKHSYIVLCLKQGVLGLKGVLGLRSDWDPKT